MPELRLPDLLVAAEAGKIFPRVVEWTLPDARRVTLVPPGHWLLIADSAPFRAELRSQKSGVRSPNPAVHVQSIAVGDRHIACFAPRESAAETKLILERYAATSQKIFAAIRFSGGRTAATSNLQPSTFNAWFY